MKWYDKQKNLFKQTEEEKLKSQAAQTENSFDELDIEDEHEEITLEETVMQTPEITTPDDGQRNDEVSILTENDTYDRRKETTVIQKNSTFKGDIETDDDITIYGTVVGDILCNGSLSIAGSIKGDIICTDASLREARIEGDIHCKQALSISENTVIHGNIESGTLYSGGMIKGDVQVQGNSQLSSKAILVGNMTSASIEMELGSVIRGAMLIGEDIDF